MVSGRLRRMAFALVLGTVGVAIAASVWMPSASDHPGEHCAAILVKSAMAAFREKESRLPDDFRTYEDALTSIAGAHATIDKVSTDRYEINLCCAGSKFRILISYRASDVGQLEDYNVLVIDRVCKCP